MEQHTPYRNRSPHGWWVASYLMLAVCDDDPNPSPKSRCLAWENTIILQAPDRNAAYEKALALAARDEGTFEDDTLKPRTWRWVVEGLTELVPLYEELEDGAEILWTEHSNRTVAKIRSWVKTKEMLDVFDDSDRSS